MDGVRGRETFIGGSEAAAVLGLSRWKTPLQVWAEKTGKIEPEDISDRLPVKLGIALEDTVAKLFCEETGKEVRRVNETRFHKDHNFLGATLDRKVVGEDAFLECKTASAFKAKEWNEDIPQEYIIQCLHYLAVTGYEKAYIAVLIGNQDFKWKEIKRDDALIAEIIGREVSFWNNYVLTDTQPMQISAKDSNTLYSLYPVIKQEIPVQLDQTLDIEINLLESLKNDLKSLEGQIEQKENLIKAHLKDHESGLSANYLVTWKEQKRTSFDSKKFKTDNPMIYQQYSKESATRVLRIKELVENI